MSNKKFKADINRFTNLTEAKLRKVAIASMLNLFTDAQNPVAKGGSMPVDTANLRNSLVVEINGANAGKGGDAFILGINRFQIGDIVQGAWTAPYAVARHYKPDSFGQGGGMWRDKAAAKWQTIVSKNARAASS